MLNISPIGMISNRCNVNVLMVLISLFKTPTPMCCMNMHTRLKIKSFIFEFKHLGFMESFIFCNSETLDTLKVKAKRIIIDLNHKTDIKSGYKIQIKTQLLQSLR